MELILFLGYVNHDISTFIRKVTLIGQSGKRPTQHIFCVAHEWRGTTYFAAETAIEKDHWIRILKDGVRHLEGILTLEYLGISTLEHRFGTHLL